MDPLINEIYDIKEKNFKKTITFLVVIIYILSFSFDFVVTFTVYSTSPGKFFALEANKLFSDILLKGGEEPLNLFYLIAIKIILALLVIIIYYLDSKVNRNISSALFIVFSFYIFHLAMVHIQGGLSWWGIFL